MGKKCTKRFPSEFGSTNGSVMWLPTSSTSNRETWLALLQYTSQRVCPIIFQLFLQVKVVNIPARATVSDVKGFDESNSWGSQLSLFFCFSVLLLNLKTKNRIVYNLIYSNYLSVSRSPIKAFLRFSQKESQQWSLFPLQRSDPGSVGIRTHDYQTAKVRKTDRRHFFTRQECKWMCTHRLDCTHSHGPTRSHPHTLTHTHMGWSHLMVRLDWKFEVPRDTKNNTFVMRPFVTHH